MMNKLKLPCLVLGCLAFAALILTVSWHNTVNRFAGTQQNNIHKNSIPPETKPQRIVSISPGHTEILFALGAGDRVVGVSSFSDYPEAAKTKPDVGNYLTPDLEKVISLTPDIVFALSETQAQYIGILEEAGIFVVAIEPRTMQEILIAIDTIAQAVGEPSSGADLRSELSGQLNEVRNRIARFQPKRVFVEVWDTPLLTVGKKSFINDIVSQAGGVNVAADKNLAYASCDIEALYAYNPEVYIVVSHNYKEVRPLITRSEFADIKAVKNKQIFPILADVLVRSGPRSFTGLAELAKIIHPEAF